jgi:DNA-directed RNA polymerase subunit M/transcription elongation factor TFIIS
MSKSLLRFCPIKGCDSLLNYLNEKGILKLKCPTCCEEVDIDEGTTVKIEINRHGDQKKKISKEMIYDPTITRTVHFNCPGCKETKAPLTEDTIPNVCMFTHNNSNRQLHLLCSVCKSVWNLSK